MSSLFSTYFSFVFAKIQEPKDLHFLLCYALKVKLRVRALTTQSLLGVLQHRANATKQTVTAQILWKSLNQRRDEEGWRAKLLDPEWHEKFPVLFVTSTCSPCSCIIVFLSKEPHSAPAALMKKKIPQSYITGGGLLHVDVKCKLCCGRAALQLSKPAGPDKMHEVGGKEMEKMAVFQSLFQTPNSKFGHTGSWQVFRFKSCSWVKITTWISSSLPCFSSFMR